MCILGIYPDTLLSLAVLSLLVLFIGPTVANFDPEFSGKLHLLITTNIIKISNNISQD